MTSRVVEAVTLRPHTQATTVLHNSHTPSMSSIFALSRDEKGAIVKQKQSFQLCILAYMNDKLSPESNLHSAMASWLF